MIKIELTQEQFYELNDAAAETIERMINEGQTPDERKYKSLQTLFAALQVLHHAGLGTADTPALQALAPRVAQACAGDGLVPSGRG